MTGHTLWLIWSGLTVGAFLVEGAIGLSRGELRTDWMGRVLLAVWYYSAALFVVWLFVE